MKRTKIVCTVGPASAKASTLRAMIRAGMNVARLNFSHGTHEAHAETMALIRAAAKAEGETVTILADLQGPKIRLGALPEAGLQLTSGKTVALSTAVSAYRDGGPLPVTFAGLHRDVKAGHRILIDDGLLEVRVTSVRGRVIQAKVVNGGKVTSHKGMNFPDTELRISAITEKDKADAAFAVANGADWVALSFVTKPAQIATLRGLIRAVAKRTKALPRVIVKIEKHEAIDRFGELLEAVDAVMVARGDLGIEIPAEQVPIWQKKIVETCRRAGKPVVVATQMLDSMIRNPRPTRAEVSDVANAVFDHADAVMLSGETASGSYPVEAVRMMARIVEEAEASPFDDVALPTREDSLAEDSAALALKALTVSGHADAALASLVRAPWAPRATALRPEIPFYLAVADEASGRQENLRWGIRPFVLPGKHGEGFRAAAIAALKREGRIGTGDRLAILDGDARGVGVELVDI